MVDIPAVCPSCKKTLFRGEFFCSRCGVQLAALNLPHTKMVKSETKPFIRWGNPTFRMGMQIIIFVAEEQLEYLADRSLEIGRATIQIKPDVDLSKYKAEELGVSRQHATLVPSASTLYIRDNKSLNGTYLQGAKIEADKEIPLRDGDSVSLGKLKIQVYFGVL